MAETTIEWTATTGPDGTVHTGYSFNAWVGCERISPACRICYAASWAKRTGQANLWEGERRRTTADYWKQPLKWNAKAKALGVRLKVFCCSLADVFDNAVPSEWRADLFELIGNTPDLDWLILTKRIGNAHRMLDHVVAHWSDSDQVWDAKDWPNVWLGATVANQAEVDRDVHKLVEVPARVRFLSVEPMLGPVDIRGHVESCGDCDPCIGGAPKSCAVGWWYTSALHPDGIHWVIGGGESGHSAIPADLEWFRSLRRQCANARTPYFMKQLGGVRDKRGKIEDLPPDLRVREFPNSTTGECE